MIAWDLRATVPAMKVLLTGATGFVGSAILDALVADGHQVTALVRNAGRRPQRAGLTYLEFDFMRPPAPAQVIELVQGAQALINAVGIIRETCDLSFKKVHTEAPLALFAAAQTAGVSRIVQISAAGTTEESPFAYFKTKAKADDYLMTKSSVPALVLRSSLVYGGRGEATALFHRLARLPVIPLPAGGEFRFRPILVQDLAALVREALSVPVMPTGIIEVGGDDEVSLKDMLLSIRAAERGPEEVPAPLLSIPRLLMQPAAWFGDVTGLGPLTSDMLEMLLATEPPDIRKMRETFSFQPRGFRTFIFGLSPQAS